MKAIIALQKLVLTPSSKVSDILRHAYLIACKLNLEDFKKWCELELNGYFDIPDEDVPKDRYIFGSLCVKNSLDGSRATFQADAVFSGQLIKESISFFEEAVATTSESIKLQQKDSLDALLRKANPQLNGTNFIFYIEVSKAPFYKVLENIKFKILELSYELEKQGILGEEWEFTEQEKQMTQNINYHIGNVGNMANHNDNSTINQTSTNTVQVIKGDFNSLASKLKDYGVEDADIEDLRNVIDVTPSPASSDELGEGVTNWLGKMSLKALKGSLKVGKDVAMGVLVEAITTYYCG
ncbi:AbiTii domain-containing protein [Acinetobacter nosocomialis]|uniref:AbiTii domain-containing protein n=1 Tax=Acinetobacter nosocomialis TaxID=106654 RepID=UPI000DE77073|nr:hypothetical protein [Acinetobacter nosocomialis]SSO39341.1 Uncharacterised protein [Acinetobacter nosocomialis]SSP56509.1 Uncharacterised protein [Acinetobacter nosocomialis]SSQ41724.1 Uncharacterised protein [Acinetobacter baumannii]